MKIIWAQTCIKKFTKEFNVFSTVKIVKWNNHCWKDFWLNEQPQLVLIHNMITVTMAFFLVFSSIKLEVFQFKFCVTFLAWSYFHVICFRWSFHVKYHESLLSSNLFHWLGHRYHYTSHRRIHLGRRHPEYPPLNGKSKQKKF